MPAERDAGGADLPEVQVKVKLAELARKAEEDAGKRKEGGTE